MFRPAPDTFFGSTREDGLPGEGLAETIVPCFATLAVIGALAVWVGAYIRDGHADPFEVLKVSCCVLLAPALLGVWLSRRIAAEPQRVITRLYAMILHGMTPPGPLSAPHVAEVGVDGIAGLIGQILRRTMRLARVEQAAQAMRQALCSGQAQAARLTVDLRYEAADLAQAATQIGSTGACIAREMQASAGSLTLGDLALARAADTIECITANVRATTCCVEQMTSTAVHLSDIAHATHAAVAGHEDRSSHLVVALDRIEQAVQTAVRLLRDAAQPEARMLAEEGGPAGLAHQMIHAAGDCQPALFAAHTMLRELMAETKAANTRIVELGEIIGKQHELGLAVGHAVQQQAADIGAVLTDLYEARSGFAMLRASVDAVAQAGSMGLDVAGRMRETALRLPSQADRMAEILRGIPDFGPLDEAWSMAGSSGTTRPDKHARPTEALAPRRAD